jgi:hypothetical protein
VKLKRHGGGMRRCKRLLRIKKCFNRMHLDRSADNIERYKVAKKTAKWAVSEAKVRYMMEYTSGCVRRNGRRTSIGRPKAERGR